MGLPVRLTAFVALLHFSLSLGLVPVLDHIDGPEGPADDLELSMASGLPQLLAKTQAVKGSLPAPKCVSFQPPFSFKITFDGVLCRIVCQQTLPQPVTRPFLVALVTNAP